MRIVGTGMRIAAAAGIIACAAAVIGQAGLLEEIADRSQEQEVVIIKKKQPASPGMTAAAPGTIKTESATNTAQPAKTEKAVKAIKTAKTEKIEKIEKTGIPLPKATATPDLNARLKTLEEKTFLIEEQLKKNTPVAEISKTAPKISGIIQASYSVVEDTTTSTSTNFALKRVRVLLSGAIDPDHIKYFIQTELTGSPTVLDARIHYLPSRRWEIVFGRFIPSFTYYLPMSVAKLDFVNYPLVISKYQMGRQAGIQSTYRCPVADLNAGIFNGYPANNLSDSDRGKDALLSGVVRLPRGFSALGYGWFGNCVPENSASDTRNRYGGGIFWEHKLSATSALSVKDEYIAGYDKKAATGAETDSNGYYAQMSWRLNSSIELLARYDLFDPNTKISGDRTQWTTGGINYYLRGTSAMFYLNYVRKYDEAAPSFRDDEYSLQAQVNF